MNPKKGEEELNRVILLMKYDNRMTLSENVELTSEQWEQIKAGLTPYYQRAKKGIKSIIDDPKSAIKKGIGAAIKGAYENPAILGSALGAPSLGLGLSAAKNWDDIEEYFSNLNTHDWLMFIEIGASIGVVFGGPFAPLFLGIELAASSADAYLYFKEGDPYMGSMVLALNLIPGGQLGQIFKGLKWFPKKGPRYTKLLLEKAKKGGKLSKVEQDELAQLAKEFTEQSGPISKALKRAARTNLAKSLASKTPQWIMNFIIGLSKSKAVKLSMFVAKFGGTVYTIDKLYLFVFRDTIFKDESKLDSRTKNELRFMINNLLGYEEAVNEFLVKKTTDSIMNLEDEGQELLKSDVTEEMVRSDFERMLKEFEKNPTTEQSAQEPSEQSAEIDYDNPEIQKVLNKEINPSTKKPFVIKRGQQGEGVKQIQIMLNNLKYDYLLNNYGKLESGVDNKFGPYTEEAVKKFQSDNQLKVDGVVGSETLSKLIELTKK
jgi:hypothetical protein